MHHFKELLFRLALCFVVVGMGLAVGRAEAQTVTPDDVTFDPSLAGDWTLFPIIVRSNGGGGGQATDLTQMPGRKVTLAVSADGSQLEIDGPSILHGYFADALEGIDLVDAIPLQIRAEDVYSFALETTSDDAAFPYTTDVRADLHVVAPDQIDVYERYSVFEGAGAMRGVMVRGTVDPRPALLPYDICKGGPAPHLAPGQTVTVEYLKGLNLRAQPDSKSARVAAVDPFSTLQVLDGPTCASSMAYWHVQVGSQTGWLSEGAGSDYWLDSADQVNVPEPFVLTSPMDALPLPEATVYTLASDGTLTSQAAGQASPQPVMACPGGAQPMLKIGGQATVLPGDPNAFNTKPASHSADPTSQRIALIQPGEIVDVVDGPVCANNITWWQVNYLGKTGWTGEMQGTTYWMGPLP